MLNGGRSELRASFVREVNARLGDDDGLAAGVVAADADVEAPWLGTQFVADEAVGRFGPPSQGSLLALGAGLFAAPAEIHPTGPVHREIKPSNVMVGVDGPKVIDFGIAAGPGQPA